MYTKGTRWPYTAHLRQCTTWPKVINDWLGHGPTNERKKKQLNLKRQQQNFGGGGGGGKGSTQYKKRMKKWGNPLWGNSSKP